jgi:predicted DNA-binding transcriptional regulator AlpA
MQMTIKYLNEKQVAEMTGRSLSTLRNERSFGRGIPYSKVGRSVRYSLADVVKFMEGCKIETTDSVGFIDLSKLSGVLK